LPHQLSYSDRILITALLKSGNERGAIGRGTVLAQLELALKPADGDVEADDPLQHALEIGFGEILDPPWDRVAGFVAIGQAVQQPMQSCTVFDQSDCPVGVDVDIVPGWDTLAALIPARRDIAVRPTEN